MPIFYYKAIHPLHGLEQGIIHAHARDAAYESLKQKSLHVIRLSLQRAWFQHKIHLADWENICRDFCRYLHYFNVVDVLHILQKQEKKDHIRILFLGLIDALNGGKTLSDALKTLHPKTPNTLIALLKNGEQIGDYRQSFLKALDYFTWRLSVQNTLQSALRYPIFIGFFLMGVLGFFAFFVTPALSPLFENNPESQTLIYKILFKISHLKSNDILIWGGYGLAMVATLKLLQKFEFLLWRIPLMRRMGLRKHFTYFANEMHVYLSSHMGLVESLRFVKNDTGSETFQTVLNNILKHLDGGMALSESLSKEQAPEFLVYLVRVGEKTASLDQSFQLFCETEFSHQKQKIEKILSILQPMALLFMGGIMVWLIMGLISPLYDSVLKVS